jgi:hypothetical protein
VTADLTPLLVDEATKKSGLVWVGDKPVWLLWHGDVAWVLTGPGEQPDPGLTDGGTVDVNVRSKEKGTRLVTWQAQVSLLDKASDTWSEVVPLLMGKRLNLVDGEAAAGRWAREATVFRLTPTGSTTPMPDDSLAAPPPETPATTDVPIPFTVGKATSRLPRRRS